MSKASKMKLQAIILGVMITISLLAIVATASCRPKEINQDTFSYRIVKVQGMTCIQWGNPISYKGGLICNWDEWEKIE